MEGSRLPLGGLLGREGQWAMHGAEQAWAHPWALLRARSHPSLAVRALVDSAPVG